MPPEGQMRSGEYDTAVVQREAQCANVTPPQIYVILKTQVKKGCCRQVLNLIQIDLRSNASSVINSSARHLNEKNRFIHFC
uniref:HTH_48 domain-containing protein n=1 Tax=Mesocestoides corti TaxID=53468 RepID=A0A5K3FQ39_MESCO